MGQVTPSEGVGKCADRLLLRKESEGMKDAEPHHSAYTGNATISLLRKESRKRADRLLLRKESDGMKDAEPHHSAYTGNATI